MQTFFLYLFWMSILLCLGTYFIYPFIIWIVGLYRPFEVDKKVNTPLVSIIISAFNEATHISRKIKNTLEIEYPEDRIEILIGSDGSSDNTAAIMDEYTNEKIRFFNFTKNRGKTAVQNDLVQKAKGDVLVFTDAASFISTGSIRSITCNFNDDRIGCVAGCMRFLKTDTNLATQSQGLYWQYESRLRKLESHIGSLIGVDGPLYAVRAECYVPLQDHIISDLLTPLLVLANGKKTVLESEAFVDEEPTEKTEHEFRTRRRITLRGLKGLYSHKYLLNLLKHPLLSVQIIFHKLLRWFVGPLVILNFLSCLAMLESLFFRGILVLYAFYFLLAGAGWIAQQRGKRARLLTVPYYFTLVNAAATAGIIDFFRGKQAVTWKPERKQTSEKSKKLHEVNHD